MTFRAAPYFTKYGTGAGEYESWDGLVAFKATKNGTTLKEVELGANNTDRSPGMNTPSSLRT